jgi:hypothetical protein
MFPVFVDLTQKDKVKDKALAVPFLSIVNFVPQKLL